MGLIDRQDENTLTIAVVITWAHIILAPLSAAIVSSIESPEAGVLALLYMVFVGVWLHPLTYILIKDWSRYRR